MNIQIKSGIVVLVVLSFMLFSLSARAVEYEANWDSLDSRPTPQWFLDAKFGIFIHWGVYSVPAWGKEKDYAEWYWNRTFNTDGTLQDNEYGAFHRRVYGEDFQYHYFVPMFKCEMYDPDEWADIFNRSGAKYIVPTSKHHDGFCLWPSAEANKSWGRLWNSVDAGPNRDLLGELMEAGRKKGLKMGFYYSLYEWFNPLWLLDRERFVAEHMHPQFKDVVTRYRPAIIFSDGEWSMPATKWKSVELLQWLYNESPCKDYVIVNDRWGKGCRHEHGGYYTTEYGAGMADATHPWEESRGMGFSYGYNRNEPVSNYKSSRELILILVDMVSRGGNFLLDIGPTADGRIPEIMQDRLLDMGQWLEVNGEAIYATRAHKTPCQWSEGKKPSQQYGEFREKYHLLERVDKKTVKPGLAVIEAFYTSKPDALYAITPGWPGDTLRLHDVNVNRVADVALLGFKGDISWKKDGQSLVLDLSDISADELPCEWAYAFKMTYK